VSRGSERSTETRFATFILRRNVCVDNRAIEGDNPVVRILPSQFFERDKRLNG